MQDAQSQRLRMDTNCGPMIDWSEIGAQVRRLAMIAAIEHLDQQRVDLCGGRAPCLASSPLFGETAQ